MSTSIHLEERDDVHARASTAADALCGRAPDGKRWTVKRSQVTCLRCIDEICRRDSKVKTR
jgi:hypothetical protein